MKQPNSHYEYDCFVIGAGSGGVRAARMAAAMGARVEIAEDRYMGGTCVNVGCVPKKLYVYASEFGKGFKDAEGFGWQASQTRFDWATLRDNKKTEIARLNGIYESLLEKPGALEEGMAFAKIYFGGEPSTVDYNFMPTAVFSQPNVGTVGLTEEPARAEYDDARIFRSEFRPMKHTLGGRNERSMMKLVVDNASDTVVGLHMVGPDAGEIVQSMAIALRLGATKADFDRTVGIHPTAAEEFVTMREPVSD